MQNDLEDRLRHWAGREDVTRSIAQHELQKHIVRIPHGFGSRQEKLTYRWHKLQIGFIFRNSWNHIEKPQGLDDVIKDAFSRKQNVVLAFTHYHLGGDLGSIQHVAHPYRLRTNGQFFTLAAETLFPPPNSTFYQRFLAFNPVAMPRNIDQKNRGEKRDDVHYRTLLEGFFHTMLSYDFGPAGFAVLDINGQHKKGYVPDFSSYITPHAITTNARVIPIAIMHTNKGTIVTESSREYRAIFDGTVLRDGNKKMLLHTVRNFLLRSYTGDIYMNMGNPVDAADFSTESELNNYITLQLREASLLTPANITGYTLAANFADELENGCIRRDALETALNAHITALQKAPAIPELMRQTANTIIARAQPVLQLEIHSDTVKVTNSDLVRYYGNEIKWHADKITGSDFSPWELETLKKPLPAQIPYAGVAQPG